MGAKREERIMDERRNAFESKKTNKTDARLECPSRIFDVEHNENVLQQQKTAELSMEMARSLDESEIFHNHAER